MAKKKKTPETVVETIAPPLSGKTLFSKAAKPVQTDLPAIKVKPKERKATEGVSKDVLNHLHLLEIYGVLSVPDFRGYSNTGDLAAIVLKNLEAAGLAHSKWEKSRTVFRLTPAGKQYLDKHMPASA